MARPTPTLGTTSSSVTEFREVDNFAANYVVDRPRIYIPLCPMNVAHAVGSTEVLKSVGTNTISLSEIGTSECQGFTSTATGDSVSVLVPLPADIDLAEDIRFRALCSQNAGLAAAGSSNVTFTYLECVVGTTAVAVAASAMSSDGSATANVGPDILQWSSWSTLDGATLTSTPGDDFLILKAATTLTTIVDLTLWGFEMQYYRKFIGGDEALV